jgi:hypothetical protein
VDGNRLLDDQTIADELSDVLTGVGIGNLVDFIRIKPDLLFTAFHHGCG